jgi:hypothetical protein
MAKSKKLNYQNIILRTRSKQMLTRCSVTSHYLMMMILEQTNSMEHAPRILFASDLSDWPAFAEFFYDQVREF